MRILVTGTSGLIGSDVCCYFGGLGHDIHGIDDNRRPAIFGPQREARRNRNRLHERLPRFVHHEIDIRHRKSLLELFEVVRPDAVVHAAAQPSLDLAAAIPFDDFDENAVGTLNLLEATRRTCAESPFVFMSTNKVYGDGPNGIARRELESRWAYADARYARGISETFPIDHCKHLHFGASTVATDVMVQEYGRYFDMPTACLRGDCLTGPGHSGVQLHGFLSDLVRCNVEEREYTIFGYKGKQVRDTIHAVDVARFIHEFIQAPRAGAVYNIGGGRANSCSILEAFKLVENVTGKRQRFTYTTEHRIGAHVCYYSDLSRAKADYPGWDVRVTLEELIEGIAGDLVVRLAA